jgi:nitroimidazol reductase NimA-like FMN-containing flavoprotein (pyridoxamine 5'-phosphate oxidase superfamily)
MSTEDPSNFEPTSRTTAKRRAYRAQYDVATVHAIIDEALVCHVAFVDPSGGHPVVLPTLHARVGSNLFLHGSAKNRMFGALATGIPCSIAFTLVDGLVFARTAFHHSMNYRSVVAFGTASAVTDLEAKRSAFRAIVDKAAVGRADEARAPSAEELAATLVVVLPIVEASAKIRSGPPLDKGDELDEPVWAGEVPLRIVAGTPIPDTALATGMAVSPSIVARIAGSFASPLAIGATPSPTREERPPGRRSADGNAV